MSQLTGTGLGPHPARGVAQVIGPRSGVALPAGRDWEPPMDAGELENLLARLRRWSQDRGYWGIRSLITGGVYPFAASAAEAELVRQGTGSPDRYEVVFHDGHEWVSSSGVPGPAELARDGVPERETDGDSLASGETARHGGGRRFKDGD